MTYYTGDKRSWRKEGDTPALPTPISKSLSKPEDYRVSANLETAVNVALMLGQPLLLTGDPGVGKTTLAYNVGPALGMGEPLKFDVKSDTEARDLFYTFDAARYLRDPEGLARDFITFQALGRALLLTRPANHEDVGHYWDERRNGAFTGPKRSIVLIDEIDKAPRDVPNDLLNEFEHAYFRVFEDENRQVESDPELRPVVIITSNSEKQLPDAFLRRCVYHHIEFPNPEELKQIVSQRLQSLVKDGRELSDRHVNETMQLFNMLRQRERGVQRTPGTAELLAALMALKRRRDAVEGSLKRDIGVPLDDDAPLREVLSALVKNKDDWKVTKDVIPEWRSMNTRPAGVLP